LLIAVFGFFAAGAAPSPWALAAIVFADGALALAVAHWARWRGHGGWRADGESALAVLVLLCAYLAFVAVLLGLPLRWYREGASLGTVLAVSAAAVLVLLALWRLWPAFGLVLLRPTDATGERRSQLVDAVRTALRLTADNEIFFGLGLPVAIALLFLAQGASSIAGYIAPLAAAYRLPLLAGYAILAPIAFFLILRNSAQARLHDALRSRALHAPVAEPIPDAMPMTETPAPALPAQLCGEDLNAMLLQCVRAGQTQLALEALARGADPNTVPAAADRDQRSALVLAVLNPDLRLLRGFIAKGANVNRVHAGLTPLIAATRDSSEGRDEAVMTLLTNGASVQGTDAQGNTALHLAALSTRPIVAALLCDAGARLDAVNAAGQNPLAVACAAANWELAQFLLDYGCKPEAPHTQPAILAAAAIANDDPLGVKLLLKRRVHVDARDSLQRTALMVAALHGHAMIAKVLLDAGADVNAADAHGATPLIEAARAGAADVIEVLARHRPAPDAVDQAGRTALIVACQSGRANEETVRRLLALGISRQLTARDGRRAVECAAAAGRWNLVAAIDAEYPRPASVDANATSAAETAVDTPEHLLDALRFGNWHIVARFDAQVSAWPPADLANLFLQLDGEKAQAARQWLLNHGLEPNTTTEAGSLLLRLLDKQPASLDAARQLLDAGAQVGGSQVLACVLDAAGKSPADTAQLQDLARRLLASGADPFFTDARGQSLLARAAALGWVELVVRLLELGVDPQARDHEGRTALFAAMLAPRDRAEALLKAMLRAGADPEVRAANNETPLGLALGRADAAAQRWLNWPQWKLPGRALRDSDLIAAATQGDKFAVEKLLDLGLAIDAQDAHGATALLHAAGYGHAALVGFLLDRGANPAHVAATGATALSAAVRAGQRKVVTLLLARSIDVDQPLHEQRTCLMLAAGQGNAELVELLLDHGARADTIDDHGAGALHAVARFAFAHGEAARANRICAALLAKGAAIDARNHDGQTPLLVLFGAHAPPRTGADQRALLDVAQLLHARGASIDVQDARGVSPLHACAMHGLLLPLRALLAAGADPSCRDLLERTPREVAHLLGFIDMATELTAVLERRRVV
jgi:ankyrin repeat protein